LEKSGRAFLRFREEEMDEYVSQFWEDLRSGRFVSMVKEASKGQAVENAQEVYNIMKPLFAREDDVEEVYFIFLNSKNRILAIEKLFAGSLTASSIYTRELIKRILKNKASAIVMVHAHPSGDPEPSVDDRSISIKIGIAAASIDVCFHDHIIIGDGYHSMAGTGWLKAVSRRFSDHLDPSPKGGGHD